MWGTEDSIIHETSTRLTRIYVVSRPDIESSSFFEPVVRFMSRPWRWHESAVKIFGGHYSVLKSVLFGLRAVGVSYRLNPNVRKIPDHSNVLILSGETELRYLLSRGDAVRITVGPNFHNDVSQVLRFLEDPSVISVLVPSTWVANVYTFLYPSIRNKVVVWAAATEVPRFAKELGSRFSNKRILVYAKGDQGVVRGVCDMLSRQGYKFSLLTYGSHSRLRYLFELARSKYVIYVGRTESQGLALQEAWAMSVRTLVYKENVLLNKYIQDHKLQNIVGKSSFAPYLNCENGSSWTSIQELEDLLGIKGPSSSGSRSDLEDHPLFPASHREAARNLLRIMCG